MTGKIVKGIAGFYYVKVVGSGIYECKAKGIFRKEGFRPLVGDEVEFSLTHTEDTEGSVGEPLANAWLQDYLDRSGFWPTGQAMVEKAFALGRNA